MLDTINKTTQQREKSKIGVPKVRGMMVVYLRNTQVPENRQLNTRSRNKAA